MPRPADIGAAVAVAAAWAAVAHFTAGIDRFFIMTFFLAAFFLYIASALTEKRWAALVTAFAAAVFSVHSASMAGPGIYKLPLLLGAGAAFEAVRMSGKEPRLFAASIAAAATMPIFMWLVSEGQTDPTALADLIATAALAGAAGATAGFLTWGRIGHAKAVIRFQCAGTGQAPPALKRFAEKGRRRKTF